MIKGLRELTSPCVIDQDTLIFDWDVKKIKSNQIKKAKQNRQFWRELVNYFSQLQVLVTDCHLWCFISDSWFDPDDVGQGTHW